MRQRTCAFDQHYRRCSYFKKMRRVASQVHHQTARLLQANFLEREPAWFQAVLDNPPLPLPPKAPTAKRTSFDLRPGTSARPVHSKKTRQPKPLPIYFIEDDLRRQFFRDHPFETFRPVSLVEGAGVETEHPIQGKQWTRLRQRTTCPRPEEYVFCKCDAF